MTHTYLLDDNYEYKIAILYILKELNEDVRNIIYNKLLTFEILELMTHGWTELVLNVDDYQSIDLYDLDIYQDQ